MTVSQNPPALPAWLRPYVEGLEGADSMAYLALHSHSFRYAARFLPAPYDGLVADVYAFCRFTDDLVDGAEPGTSPATLTARLEEWSALARAAYAGTPSGFALLDRPLMEMGRRGIPFAYAEGLIEGVAMDLVPRRYDSLAALDAYSYRVASVVGLWLTRLVGISDPDVLARAADLGHAMQLTNILRDVGEDFARGRLYLPRDVLARHGLDEAAVAEALTSGRLPAGWAPAMEELMRAADARYESAIGAIVHLPVFFRRPVMVSALVYRDIHTAIRRNRHDNLRRRAHTTLARKMWLGVSARARLMLAPRRARAVSTSGTGPVAPPIVPAGPVDSSHSLTFPALVPAASSLASSLPLLSLVAPLILATAVMATTATPATGEGTAVRFDESGESRARRELAQADAALRAQPDAATALELRLVRLRLLHALSVQDESLLPAARAARADVERLVARPGRTAGTAVRGDLAPLLLAYRGALDVVEARHAFWPGERMTPLKRGLPLLDSAVRRDPDNAEIRYLRLTSGYYLPFFLGRKPYVREDFRALAGLLPRVRDAYPSPWYLAIADFVLEKGGLPDGQIAALRRARAEVASDRRLSRSERAPQTDYTNIP